MAQDEGLVRTEWRQQTVDRGRGLVYLREFPVDGGSPDTLPLRTAPRSSSRLRGYFIWEPRGDHGGAYVLAASDSIVPNVLEFAYEVAGLPIDSVTPDKAWARAILGADSTGSFVTAWVRLDPARAAWLWWEEDLPKRGRLYLVEPGRVSFASRPGGPARASPLSVKHRADDHSLEVLDRRGSWIQVRFTQPAGICGVEAAPDQVRDTLWVRYLDVRGRPLVWYFTRGC